MLPWWFIAIAAAAAVTGASAQTTIYKCQRPGQPVIYQDSRCGPRETALPFDNADFAANAGRGTPAGVGASPSRDSADAVRAQGTSDAAKDTVPATTASASATTESDASPTLRNSYMTIIQTLLGLMFASMLVAVVAWKTRRPRPQGGEDTGAAAS